MTVGELKNVIDEVPDDTEVFYLSIGLDILDWWIGQKKKEDDGGSVK